jgi:hypothetical protein
MGTDVLVVSRIGQGRSMRRAITASVIATIRKGSPEKVLRAAWGKNEGALQLLNKAATAPTGTGDFPTYDAIGTFRSLSPASAALKLFDVANKLDLSGVTTIRVPNVATLPPRPVESAVPDIDSAPSCSWLRLRI